MKPVQKSIASFASLALICAPAASALGAFTTTMIPEYDGQLATGQRGATGDQFDTIIGVFNTLAGAPLNVDPDNHVFPATASSMGNNPLLAIAEDLLVTATETPGPGPNQVTIDFEWGMASGESIIPAGSLLSGAPITTVSFEMGTANAGGDGLGWGMPFTFDAPEDAMNPGTFLADFTLLGLGGSELFSGTWFVNDIGGNEFAGATFVSAGGADLAGFDITGARASVTVNEVPEPASLALLGLGACMLVRRRR